ncbi:MAG TPA: hypothetical protein VG167_00895 [Verrucomicrobiae bacterium]|nr:hypothetical protein [Verrucomicrobiae bacterium]
MSVHNPSVTVQIGGGSQVVEVRELVWPDALSLYSRLMAQAKEFLDEKGQFDLKPEKIVAALSENIELGTWLVLKSTGRDEAWLQSLSLSAVLDLATEAAVLNIGIIVERVKKAKGRLAGLVGGAQGVGVSTLSLPTKPSS